jgi:hypothetical protein
VDGAARAHLHPVWDWTARADRLDHDFADTDQPHLEAHPFASLTYWAPNHTCTECGAELVPDDDTRIEVWERFVAAPEPVGYDPSIIPVWTSPTAESFVAMKLTPWRLRVMPGEVMTQARTDLLLTWRA